uniref:2-oxoglutarate and iron-dependent oxygenase domain containing 2 n=1 Tax=Oncorhynchus mykiss TaxID=8022 RepID=A0A8C7TRB2_ONCMY
FKSFEAPRILLLPVVTHGPFVCNVLSSTQILLNELGFDNGFTTPLRVQYLHKAFMVKYDIHEDLDLVYHYDNAEVTQCVPNQMRVSTEVEQGMIEGLLYRGQHMHGSLPISSGQCWNLIVWMRASQERTKLCPMCKNKPTLVEGQGFTDGFTSDSGMSLLQDVSCVLR